MLNGNSMYFYVFWELIYFCYLHLCHLGNHPSRRHSLSQISEFSKTCSVVRCFRIRFISILIHDLQRLGLTIEMFPINRFKMFTQFLRTHVACQAPYSIQIYWLFWPLPIVLEHPPQTAPPLCNSTPVCNKTTPLSVNRIRFTDKGVVLSH